MQKYQMSLSSTRRVVRGICSNIEVQRTMYIHDQLDHNQKIIACPIPSTSACPLEGSRHPSIRSIIQNFDLERYSYSSFDKRVSHWEGATTYTEEGGSPMSWFMAVFVVNFVATWGRRFRAWYCESAFERHVESFVDCY